MGSNPTLSSKMNKKSRRWPKKYDPIGGFHFRGHPRYRKIEMNSRARRKKNLISKADIDD